MDSIARIGKDSLAAVLSPVNYPNLVGLWFVYRVALALYNISPLHPLYKFPGPKLAAMGYFYEGYYDFWLGGRYGHEIRRMHKLYGPIVRINPDELHCNDPSFTDEIYAGGGRIRDKWSHFLNTSSGPITVGTFSTRLHESHRVRRGAMSRFFSRGQMLRLEHEVKDFVQCTVNKVLRTKGPFNVKDVFDCFTADIISQYAFGEPMGFVGQEGWTPNFGTWVAPFFDTVYIMRHVPLVRSLVGLAPMFAKYMGEDVRALFHELSVNIPAYIQRALDNKEDGRVFADLISSPQLPDSDKTIYRLSGQGFDLLSAGTETTAAALTCIVYWLLAKPEVYTRLTEDLKGVDPENLKWTDLEQKPYLWAVIHEVLRQMPGISHRSARLAREETLIYKNENGDIEYVIPRNTPIGMTSMINHKNESLFPSPEEFIPERWLLENGQQNYALEKYLISFSRGSRVCLGMHLAYCELYLMTATMAFKVLPKARLHETTIEDIKYDHDAVVPHTKKGSVAVRIVLS